MSAIASFYVVPRSDLPELSNEVDDVYDWSGLCFVHMMDLLEKRGVYVGSELPAAEEALNEEDLAYVLTPAAMTSLEQLNPDLYDEDDIRRHFAEFGLDFQEAGLAGKDALAILAEQLGALDEDQALVVTVG